MFTKNLIITFLSLVVGILSYFKFNSDNDIQENYINYNLAAVPETINLNKNTGNGHASCNNYMGNGSRYSLPGSPQGQPAGLSYNTPSVKFSQQKREHYSPKIMRQAQHGSNAGSKRGMTRGLNNGAEFYTVPGTYQANLSPRMMSEGFGGNINYNPPAQKNMALRANDPMMLANSVEKPSPRENYNQAMGAQQGSNQPSTLEAPPLPQPTMESNFADLSQDNVITYDRYMWSTSYDRNASQGDFIRGDLPVIPNIECNGKGWFNTHQQHRPNTSLLTGAMAVMGGIDAATSQQTASLVMQSLGGSNLTAGGVGWEGESFACPPNTAVSELLNQGVNQGTMSTIASSTGNGGNANTGVVVSAFP